MSNFAGGKSESVNSTSGSSKVGQSGYLASDKNTAQKYDISIDSVPVSNDSLESASSQYAAFRVIYDPNMDPYTPYVALRCFVTSINDKKFFIGIFDTDTGDIVPVIQIPLVGQSIDALIARIRSIPSVSVQTLNDLGFHSVESLVEGDQINATDAWAYFFIESDSVRNVREGSLLDSLRFYFTSSEPIIDQNSPTQSLGGFVSPTKIYEFAYLVGPLSFYDQSLKVNNTALNEYKLLQINDEVVEVEKWDGNIAYIKKRQAYNTPIRYHRNNSIIRGFAKNDIFDLKFNVNRKQYRCIALKNTSSSEIARDLKIFSKLASRNNLSRVRIAIEVPRSEYHSGSAGFGARKFFIDASLANVWNNDHFKDCSLTFTSGSNSGQTRIVTYYDGATGRFDLDSDLPNNIKSGDRFYVDTSPAQRVKSGLYSPLTGEEALAAGYVVSDFENATFYNNALALDFAIDRPNGKDLGPQEVIYIWIEREIDDINDKFENNRFVLSVNFNRI